MADAKVLADNALKAVEQDVGNILILVSYMEHQADLNSKIIDGLVEVVKTQGATIPAELQTLIDNNKMIMQASSVDFDNLTDEFNGYKLPGTALVKGKVRNIQKRYLLAVKRAVGSL